MSDTDILIRESRSSDIEALAELERRSFASDRLSRRSLASLARSRSALMPVAVRGGQLVGYALVLTRRGSRSGRLYSLAVAPEASGAGIGLRLVRAAEAAARAYGIARLRLEVRADNRTGAGLYEKAGYSAVGRRESYYEDGMAALLYVRDLGARAGATPLRRAQPAAHPHG